MVRKEEKQAGEQALKEAFIKERKDVLTTKNYLTYSPLILGSN